jgi:hypothetical protein
MPERIQLSRAKGWRMPLNTIKVDRSTRWGNPWAVGRFGPWGRTAFDARGAVGHFEAMLKDPELRAGTKYPADLSPLRGFNLACWCPIGEPCHADVLLRVAHSGHQTETKP